MGSLLLGSALRGYTGRRGERGSKRAAIRSPVAKKPPDMTNRVIAFVCLLGVSGALGQAAQDFAQQTSDYYRDIAQGLNFIQSRSGDPHPTYGSYQDPTSLLPGVFPSVFLGGLGLLGAAYLSAGLDSLYNDNKERLDEFEWEVEERLDKLEESQDESKKEDKKLDFKAKALCKLASLFNNPTYDICSEGFDAGEIVGPSGYGRNAGQGYARSFPLLPTTMDHPANQE